MKWAFYLEAEAHFLKRSSKMVQLLNIAKSSAIYTFSSEGFRVVIVPVEFLAELFKLLPPQQLFLPQHLMIVFRALLRTFKFTGGTAGSFCV